MAYGTSAAVRQALQRRMATSSRRKSRDKWFIDQARETVGLTVVDAVTIATEFLRTKIVKNLSVPVDLDSEGNVIGRSKPGEFPRAETTLLMKTIFTDYDIADDGSWIEGFIGTPLDYGLFLELYMDRSFLSRTLYEEMGEIELLIGQEFKHESHEGYLTT